MQVKHPAVARLVTDEEAIADLAIHLAYRQIDAQRESFGNIDSKAVALLGFDAAALAAVLAIKDSFHGYWGGVAVLVLGSALFAVGALSRNEWEAGPDAYLFYRESTVGPPPIGPAEAKAKLMSQLIPPAMRTKSKSRGNSC